MSQVIRISEITFKRLESLAKGFDTPNNVIDRLLDHAETRGGSKIWSVDPEPNGENDNGSIITLDIDNPSDLTHTKLLKGHINETVIKNWAQLLYFAHRLVFNHLGNFEALQDATLSNIKNGKFEENGYKYYEDIDISIQGENANNSWHNALHLVKQADIEKIEILFMWRVNKSSAHPGRKGLLLWERR